MHSAEVCADCLASGSPHQYIIPFSSLIPFMPYFARSPLSTKPNINDINVQNIDSAQVQPQALPIYALSPFSRNDSAPYALCWGRRTPAIVARPYLNVSAICFAHTASLSSCSSKACTTMTPHYSRLSLVSLLWILRRQCIR